MRAVNLLPHDLEQGRKSVPLPAIVGCAGAVLAAAVLAGGYLQASSKVGDGKTRLAQLEAELAAVPRPASVDSSAVTGLPQERQARLSAVGAALSERVAWDRILREVSLVLPEDVWLTGLQGRSKPAAGATDASTAGFTLDGYTYSQAAVARLLSRLVLVPDLEDVTLADSAVKDTTPRTVEFTIIGNVKVPGAPRA